MKKPASGRSATDVTGGWLICALAVALPTATACGGHAGADGGNPDGASLHDSGWPDAGTSDSGAAAANDAGGYSPYVCDTGGSAYDVQRTFVTALGLTDVVTICGPRLNGTVLAVSPPSDGGSAYALLGQALLDAVDAGATELLLTPGVYDFRGLPSGADNLAVVGRSDLLIDGQGSTLIFHGFGHGLAIRSSQRILVRNLVIDWGDLLAVGGTLEEAFQACDGGLGFVVGANWPLDSGNAPPLRFMEEFDVSGRRWLDVPAAPGTGWPTAAQAPIYVGGQSYCIPIPYGVTGLDSGTQVIATARMGGHAVYDGQGSSDVSFENVTVYASPDVSFMVSGAGRGARISACHVMRRPNDATRLISSNADAVNFRDSRGGCLLEAGDLSLQGDDGLNVLGQSAPVIAVTADDRLSVKPPLYALYGAGDVLEVSDGKTLAPLGGAPIASVASQLESDGGTELLFALADGGIPGLFAFDGGDPLIVFVPASSSPDFVVTGNMFHDNRARGALISARHGYVGNNTFQDNEGLYLHGTNNEGPGASDVVATGNTLIHEQFDRTALGLTCDGYLSAPVMVFGLNKAQSYPANFPVRDLVLSRNVVEGALGMGIVVTSATNVLVQSNVMLDTNQSPFDAGVCGALGAPSGAASLYAVNATGVTFSGNVRDGGSAGQIDEPSCVGCSLQSAY